MLLIRHMVGGSIVSQRASLTIAIAASNAVISCIDGTMSDKWPERLFSRCTQDVLRGITAMFHLVASRGARHSQYRDSLTYLPVVILSLNHVQVASSPINFVATSSFTVKPMESVIPEQNHHRVTCAIDE